MSISLHILPRKVLTYMEVIITSVSLSKSEVSVSLVLISEKSSTLIAIEEWMSGVGYSSINRRMEVVYEELWNFSPLQEKLNLYFFK